MLDRLLREPTLIAEVLRQGLLWSLAMGFVSLTGDQLAMTLSLGSAVLMVINRALVRPTKSNGE